MAMHEAPIVGAAYEDAEGQSFEVVGYDEDEGVVEIEYEDGSIDEIDIDSWYALDVERVSDEEDDEDEGDGEDHDDADYDEDEDYDDEDYDEEEEQEE